MRSTSDFAPLPGAHHAVDIATQRAAGGRGVLRKLAVAQHRAENVVEVVRHAARERAHRFELLGLQEARFESPAIVFRAPPFGDVVVGLEDRFDLPSGPRCTAQRLATIISVPSRRV